MEASTRGDVLRAIVARTDLDRFTERVLDSFWERPEYQRLQLPRDEIRAWVRWNMDLVIRWLTEARPPDEAELELFRRNARDRAAAGTPADIVPANFRRGARFAWRAMLGAATEEERPALLEAADLLFEYVDRVSSIYFEVYEAAATSAIATAEETRARALLQRIALDQPPLPEDLQLAERIGFDVDRPSRPFVIASARRPAEYHAQLAAQLRRRGALAVSEGRRVAGLGGARSAEPWRGLELDGAAVAAHARAAIGGERGRSLEELRTVVEVALSRGRSGVVEVAEYLPELLLRRSPRVAAQIGSRLYGRLDDAHPELARTLDLLVENGFERGRTAAALPVHRNTLRDRIGRISEITDVDLGSPNGRGLAWLAWLGRRDAITASTEEPGGLRMRVAD